MRTAVLSVSSALHVCLLTCLISCLFPLLITSAPIEDEPTSQGEAGCPSNQKWYHEEPFCYLVVKEEKSFLDASATCASLHAGSELMYVASEDEQELITSIVRVELHQKKTDAWIGLSHILATFNWRWVTGERPLAYLNWAQGQPEMSKPKENCITMNRSNGQWKAKDCTEKLPFVCKMPEISNPNSTLTSTTPLSSTTLSTASPDRRIRGCRKSDKDENWFHFDSRCYLTVMKSATWPQARHNCLQRNSDLPSLHTTLETHNLVLAYKRLHEHDDTTIWIGMHAERTSETGREFRWVNNDSVVHTDWDLLQPNNFMVEEMCVNVDTTSKQWLDSDCKTPKVYVCVRDEDTLDDDPGPPPTDPEVARRCPRALPAYLYKDVCYHLMRSPAAVGQTAAESDCTANFGQTSHLISIADSEQQNVLHFMVGAANLYNESVWIGLTGSFKEGYKWTSGQSLTYFNFGTVDRSQDPRCGVLLTNHYQFAMWDMVSCSAQVKSYVCQAPALPTTDTTTLSPDPKTTPTPPLCPDGWKLFSGTRCFKIFAEPMAWSQLRATGNVLLTIHNAEDNARILEELKKTPNAGGTTPYWFGMYGNQDSHHHIELEEVHYFNWKAGEPRSDGSPIHCVQLDPSDGKWSIATCDQTRPYIRQLPTLQSSTSTESSTSTAPTPSSSLPSTSVATNPTPTVPSTDGCPSGYTLLENVNGQSGKMCYLISTETAIWSLAQETCSKEGAKLLSVHSKLKFPQSLAGSYWIGLQEPRVNEGFRWTDDSPMEYFNWAVNEPAANLKLDRCGYIEGENSQWFTETCTTKKPYICQKRPTPPATPKQATVTAAKTYCPAGFYHIDGSNEGTGPCFRLVDFQETVNKNVTWQEAKTLCEGMQPTGKSSLAVISSQQEQVALAAKLTQKGIASAWIALKGSTENTVVTFSWQQGKSSPVVALTPWDMGEPAHLKDKEYGCVQILGGTKVHDSVTVANVGTWRSSSCSERISSAVCMADVVELEEAPPTEQPLPSKHCRAEYSALTSDWCVASPSSSTAASFVDAKKKCDHLVSVRSAQEQLLLANYLLRTESSAKERPQYWLDWNVKGSGQTENWNDEETAPVTYTNWGVGQPPIHPKTLHKEQRSCVLLNTDFTWTLAECDNHSVHAICEFRSVPSPTSSPSPTTYKCPDEDTKSKPNDWMVQDKWCWYTGSLATAVDFPKAHAMCEVNGAHLVSLHSHEETQALAKVLTSPTAQAALAEADAAVWIGLVQDRLAGYTWTDRTAVNYWDWHANDDLHPRCAVVLGKTTDSQRDWWSRSCDLTAKVLCKKDALLVTRNDPDPKPDTKQELTTTDVLLMTLLFGSVLLLGCLLFAYIRHRRHQRRHFPHGTMMLGKGFSNVYFSPGLDEVILNDDNIDNSEFNNVDRDLTLPVINS